MDCSIMPTLVPDVVTIQTTDFFYPLVEDPYIQGKIACANVLSDLYSLGVDRCDNMLMLLACSTDMAADVRRIVTRELIRGFHDQCRAADAFVTGGQTVLNPWPIVGGVASCVCPVAEYVCPYGAVAGDVLVLTKPLGTQVAVNLHQWLHQPARWAKVADRIEVAEVRRAYAVAVASMARLNRTAARLMRKHGAHGATDVTGFGYLGHAANFAKHQRARVDVVLHTLPVIRSMLGVDALVPFKLAQGFSAETSGGLLIAMPPTAALAFCAELQELDTWPAWIVGDVVAGAGEARLSADPRIVEI